MPDGFRIASAWVEVFPQLVSDARQRLQAQLDAATSGAGATARIGVDVDTAKLTAAKAELDEFGAKDETAHARVDTGDSSERVDDLDRKLGGIGGKDETAHVHVDTGDSQERLEALDAELKSKPGDMAAAGNAAGNFSGRLALIAATVPAVAAALPAVGGAVAGVGGALAAGGLAFGGVQQAISDYMSEQNAAGQASAQNAATAFSNAVALQNAQRAVSGAEQQAAQDAITSAQQIVSAQQQVAASEHQLSEAQYGEQQAQTALTQARIAARQQLEQLNNAEIDGRLSARSAQLALQQAQLSQQQTDQNAMSTQLQKEQAALAVAQAERQLIEARQGESNATQATNKANKEGVSGNPQVLAAQHALKDAIYGVGQARQAEQSAIKALAMAREQAAYQQQRDAEAVATAQQNLANTEKQQQLQMAASGNAAQKLARDMSVLTGPQRALVREFEGFTGVLTRMERIAGKAVLPGVTEFLRGVHALLPTVDSAIAKFGGVFSSALGDIGKAFQSRRFREDLDSIINQGVRFMRLLEPISGAVGKLFGLWGKGAPATAGLATGIAAIATGFGNLFQALEPAVKPAGEILATLGKAVGDLGGPLGQVLTAFLQALAPALQTLLPAFKILADTLGQSLAQAIRGLAPALVPLAQDISQIVIALTPLLPLIAQLIADAGAALAPALAGLMPLLTALTPLIADLAKSLQPLAAVLGGVDGALGSVVGGIGDVLGWVVRLLASTKTWRDVWSGFADFVTTLWHGVDSYLRETFGPWVTFIGGIFSLITDAADVFEGNFRSGFSGLVRDLGTIWHGLEGIFETPVNFLIKTVYDGGIARLWDAVASKIPGIPKLPILPGLSSGAHLPGFGGGDRHPALLESGETVVSKEHSLVLEPLFRAVGVPGYAKGGKAGNTGAVKGGGLLPGIFGEAWDVAKIVTAVLTGNATAASNAFSSLFHSPATGDLGKMLVSIPRTLVSDAFKAVIGLFTGGGGPGGHGSPNAIVRYAESFIGKVPYVWGGETPGGWDCSGFVEWIYNHFGYHPPRTSEEQFGWVRRTPVPVTGGLAFFSGADGTVSSPGHVGIVTGPDQMVDAYGTGFGTILNRIYGSSGVVSGFGVPPGTAPGTGVASRFDSGGVLPPGMSLAVNQTGRPEAVLTPEESRALISMARAFTAGRIGGATPVVNQYFVGAGFPSAEQKAAMHREMALALG